MRHGIWGACLISAPGGKWIGGGELQRQKSERGRGAKGETTTDPFKGESDSIYCRWPVEEAAEDEVSRSH